MATSNFSPEKEDYKVGDTLHLTSSFSKTLTDQINPSLNINYNNSTGINGIIGIVYLDSIQRQFLPAKDSFNFVSITGSFIEETQNQNTIKGILFTEEQNQYKFHGGIICLRKGVYEIDVDNLYSGGIIGQNCKSAAFTMEVTNINKHINLFENAIGQSPTTQRKKIMYCFRVQ